MSLIDDLRSVAELVPPSHVPTAHELPSVLGALIAVVEHGPKALQVVERDVAKHLAPFAPAIEDVATVAEKVDPAIAPELAAAKAEIARLEKLVGASQQSSTPAAAPTEQGQSQQSGGFRGLFSKSDSEPAD